MTSFIARLCYSNECFAVWLMSVLVYFVTLHMTERWQSARKIQPMLHDRGFEWIPRYDWFVYVTDGMGLVGGVYLLRWLFWADDPMAALAVKQSLCFSSVGYMVSSTLHSITLLPGSNHASGVPVLFGGDVDKLLSNHTFHFGLFLRILILLGRIPLWAIVPGTLAYSAMLVSTRGHYSVDIVLAWWGILLVFAWVGLELPDRSDVSAFYSS
jgi:hypothetical protein